MEGAQQPRRALARAVGSIRGHIAVLVAVQLVLVAALVIVTAVNDFRQAEENASGDANAAAMLAADYLATQIDTARATLGQVDESSYLFSSPSICELIAEENAADHDGLTGRFLILRTDGQTYCPTEEPGSHSAEPWFQEVLTGDGIVEAGPLLRRDSGTQVMIFATAVPDHDLVVGSEIDLSSAADALSAHSPAGAHQPSYLLTAANGVLLSGTTGEGDGITERASVPELGWTVSATIARADAMTEATAQLQRLLVLAAAMAVFALGGAVLISRRFARPLRSLAGATRLITHGDTDAKVTPRGPTEIAELGRCFNEMVEVRNDADDAMRKALETEHTAVERLREADGVRTTFLMAISHELRTPLTTVVGYAELLEQIVRDGTQEELEESSAAIASQANRLQRLLLDLLDVERLSRGVVEPNLVDTEVRRVVMNVLEDLPANGNVHIDISSPVHARVDPALVERIVQNLVVNALKHTPKGTDIWVRAARSNGHVRLVVEDNGPGVPDDRKDAIFEAFEQNDVPSHSPGTGVGLTLVAQFAKLHGGRAWVENRRGGGASFHVELPASPTDAEPRTNDTEPRKRLSEASN